MEILVLGGVLVILFVLKTYAGEPAAPARPSTARRLRPSGTSD
jgi:hypothetical protein